MRITRNFMNVGSYLKTKTNKHFFLIVINSLFYIRTLFGIAFVLHDLYSSKG